MIDLTQTLADVAIYGAITTGAIYARNKFTKKKEIAIVEKVSRGPNPNGVIWDVQGHWHEAHVNVIYGKKNKSQSDMQYMCCVPIVDRLTDPHLRDDTPPGESIVLPEDWEDYLLSRDEAYYFE